MHLILNLRGGILQFSWNTQKNTMKDVKGKEIEQERNGKIKNADINLALTHLNYDLIDSDKNLYQRVKERVDFYKETGSRVQKNSVVMYSNVFTIPKEYANTLSDEQKKEYFEIITDYFKDEFGEENVVSAKVHLDETTPHMHLQHVPGNTENGKLQAHKVMNRQRLNKIHEELPQRLSERGYEVERGTSEGKRYTKDVHEFKKVSLQREVDELTLERRSLKKEVGTLKKETEAIRKMIQEINTDPNGLYREPLVRIRFREPYDEENDERFKLLFVAHQEFEEKKQGHSMQDSDFKKYRFADVTLQTRDGVEKDMLVLYAEEKSFLKEIKRNMNNVPEHELIKRDFNKYLERMDNDIESLKEGRKLGTKAESLEKAVRNVSKPRRETER